MHELALTHSIVEACAERAAGTRVLRVTVAVGTLSCVMPEALRFCFEIAAAGTELEGAELEILAVPGHSRCRCCGAEVTLHQPLDVCACGSTDLEAPRGGDVLRVQSMTLDQPPQPPAPAERPAAAGDG